MSTAAPPDKQRKILNRKTLLWTILAVGLLLRLNSYASGRALWIDEAMVSINIIQSNLSRLLLKPMLYYQVAPLGFLTVEKALVSLFGDSEYVLRLFPFLCSITGLWMFYRLCKKTQLSATPFWVALAGFAVSRGLVYYAGEVKQYASDVLVSLSILLLAYRVVENPANRKNILWLGLAGILAVWFAYPAYFILLGLALALMVILWRWQDKKGTLYVLLSLLGWSGSMGLYFATALESIRASKAHQDIWRDVWDKQMLSFMPPLYTPQGWGWLVRRTVEVFKYPMGSQVPNLSALVFLAGLLDLCLKRVQANKPYLWLLLTPILTSMLASALHLYPFTGRMVLFLVPNYLLLMAAGLDTITERLERFKLPRWVLPTFGLVLIIPSFFSNRLYNAQSEEIKPVLQYIQSHQQPGDAVFVYYGAQPAMAYYANRYRLPPLLAAEYQTYVTGLDRRPYADQTRQYVSQVLQSASHKYNRIWLVTTHLHGNEGPAYIALIKQQEVYLSSFRNKGAGAYLFRLQK